MGAFITEYAFLICLVSALLSLFSGLCVLVFKGRKKTYPAARNYLFIICLGFAYGCVVVGFGKYIGESETLRFLNIVRFILRALLMPLVFAICAITADVPRNRSILVKLGTLLLIALGLVHTLMTMLQTEQTAGLLYYAASPQTPFWAVIMSYVLTAACLLPLLICGVLVMIKKKNIGLLFAGLALAASLALGFLTEGGSLLTLYELMGGALMFFFLFIYIQTVQDPEQSFLQ